MHNLPRWQEYVLGEMDICLSWASAILRTSYEAHGLHIIIVILL
jgi:hypothetical protein